MFLTGKTRMQNIEELEEFHLQRIIPQNSKPFRNESKYLYSHRATGFHSPRYDPKITQRHRSFNHTQHWLEYLERPKLYTQHGTYSL